MLKSKKSVYLFLLIVILLEGMVILFSVKAQLEGVKLLDVYQSLASFDNENQLHIIMRNSRVPRILSSALVGAAFAVAGAVMQGLTQNPMADSSLMGINAGASLALAICFSFFATTSFQVTMFCSFAGAAVSTVLVFAISSLKKGVDAKAYMVLAGVSISMFFAALAQGLSLYFDVARDVLFWTAGGVSGAGWRELKIITVWIVIGLVISLLLSKSLTTVSLGEEMAQGLGTNIVLVRFACIIVVLILSGTAVSVVGSVSFVGLVIPHMARFLVGSDYRVIIPTSIVLGSFLLVMADLAARMVNPPFETPIGALISLIGVPFFLYLAKKNKDIAE